MDPYTTPRLPDPWAESPAIEVAAPPPPPRRRSRWRVPLALYGLTWASTALMAGWVYAVCVMFILTAHELGHYLQARRYRVPASLPYFIPMPISPIGTMGAIIGMRAGIAHARALFDIAITGPLAGLVPAFIMTVVGLRLSQVGPIPEEPSFWFGEPLLIQWLSHWQFGEIEAGHTIFLHPVAFAGWVGVFITALNLLPIGQLDGGHILYALLKRKAHPVAMALLLGGSVAVIAFRYWGWSLLILLLALIGPKHPPTADDHVPLGRARIVLGWLTLAFLVIGFTPTPLSFGSPGG